MSDPTPDVPSGAHPTPADRAPAARGGPPTIYGEFQGTPLWTALAQALADLTASREVAVATAPHYVIGYLCQELAARRVVDAAALRPDP